MALSDDDKKEIARIIEKTMQGSCMCGLAASSQAEMGHLVGRFRDMGDGNLNKGIEEASDAIKAWIKIRRRGEKIGGAVACFIAVSIAGGFGTLLWIGIRFALKMLNVDAGVKQ
ncbi:hypothetical protein [Desulfatitalea tepidiphila]|uniref:hypothetical protein n=1 Tax=Desulfatitalea tepidiphila TaxID=1185843 RepID=UPI0006B56F34|nr:hypothetical protein [Desulfatitalea tepidiphila]